MGVLACRRKGCNYIGCTRYSYQWGYICDRCFDQLVDSGIDTSVPEFMETSPYAGAKEEHDSKQYWSREFLDFSSQEEDT